MAYLGRLVEKAFFFGACPEIIGRARELRKKMTYCEKVLWQELRKKRLNRTSELENLGLKVIRYTNDEVNKNVKNVSLKISDEVKKRWKEITKL